MQIPEVKDKELHRIVTTTIIYRSDYTYLLTKRAPHKKVQPNKWCFPGGGLNVDDYINKPSSSDKITRWVSALEDSLRREIKEEVNLEIGKPEMYTDVAFIQPNGTPVICFCYFAPFISGEVKLDEDSTEFAWVNLIEAKNYDLIDGIWDEIKQVDEILKYRSQFDRFGDTYWK